MPMVPRGDAELRKKRIIAGIVGGLVIALVLAGSIWWLTSSMLADFEALY